MYVETRLAHYEYQPATKLISTASAMLLYIRRNTGASSALTRRPIGLPIPIHPSASAPVRPRPRKLCTHPRCNSRANRLSAWHLATVSAPVTASLKSPQAHKSRGSVQSTQTGSSRRHHPPHCPQFHLRVYPLPSLESSPAFPTYLLPPRPKPWQF
jgi:hypothetical protein